MIKDLIIVGTGDYALVAYKLLKRSGEYNIIAFSEERNFIRFHKIEDLPNIPFEELEHKASPDDVHLLIAVGPNKVNTVRERLFNVSKQKGYSLIKYISPEASVYDVDAIGENTFIFPQCVVEPYAKVGSNCVLWSGAIVAHHAEIMDHCFLAPGVCISGRTVIGQNTFLGINSTVRDNITIGEKCIIGAGAVIKKRIPPGGVYSASGTYRYSDDSFNTKV
jgi:sugar O-acyltransferase (sialic acid O-acetyltransferase NeuD family)